MYEQQIDLLRKIIAIAFCICGAGLVICANCRVGLARFPIQSAEMWQRGERAFGIGLIVLFAITFLVVIEGITRCVAKKWDVEFRFGLRALLIVVTIVALILGMAGALLR